MSNQVVIDLTPDFSPSLTPTATWLLSQQDTEAQLQPRQISSLSSCRTHRRRV